MKKPKFILRVGFQEFAVAGDRGVAALMSLLGEAIPVHARLYKSEIELAYCDEDETGETLTAATKVSLQRIPPGIQWTRKRKDGTVETLRPAALGEPPQPKKQPARIQSRGPLQLEF